MTGSTGRTPPSTRAAGSDRGQRDAAAVHDVAMADGASAPPLPALPPTQPPPPGPLSVAACGRARHAPPTAPPPAPGALPRHPLAERLDRLRPWLVLSIVAHHAAPLWQGVTAAGPLDAFALWLCRLLSEGLAGVRLPILFLAAGWLLCRDGLRERAAPLHERLRRRATSLLLPLLAWGAVSLVLIGAVLTTEWTLSAYQLWPWSIGQGGWARRWPEGAAAATDALLGLSGTPYVYPLWFLRDLYLMTLVTPLLALLARRAPAIYVGLAAAAIFVWTTGAGWAHPVSIEALAFFPLGAWIGLNARGDAWLAACDRAGPWLAGTALLLIALRAGLPTGRLPAPVEQGGAVLVAVVLIWVARRRRPVGAAPALPARGASALAFWWFVAHEPLLSGVRHAYAVLIDAGSPGWSALARLVASVATTALLLRGLWWLLSRRAPGAMWLLSGGRAGTSPLR